MWDAFSRMAAPPAGSSGASTSGMAAPPQQQTDDSEPRRSNVVAINWGSLKRQAYETARQMHGVQSQPLKSAANDMRENIAQVGACMSRHPSRVQDT